MNHCFTPEVVAQQDQNFLYCQDMMIILVNLGAA